MKKKEGFTMICNSCGKKGSKIEANAQFYYGIMTIKVTCYCPKCGYKASVSEDNY
jgi:endogenous inhibitor of DNA gyrase (YacG/DUF329 family)